MVKPKNSPQNTFSVYSDKSRITNYRKMSILPKDV